MKNKTNLFACVLIVLSINVQCNISVYAADENIATIRGQQDTNENAGTVPVINSDTAGIIDGTRDLSLDPFTKTDANGLIESDQTQ